MLNNPVIFTDLDGTLLDHHSYSFAAALPMLKKLKAFDIPVIPNTSKTFSELSSIRQELKLDGPFIIENGAAVYIPINYFPNQPTDSIKKDGFWVKSFSAPRSDWIKIIESLKTQYTDQFQNFSNMTVQQIVDCTGLTEHQAKLASNREFGEPVLWLGSEETKLAFIQQIKMLGATPLQGGRFLHVSGDCDKGKALVWLQQQFVQQFNYSDCQSIALGDGQNDVAMLEAADVAVRIASPVNPLPSLNKQGRIFNSKLFGPAGWNECLQNIIFN